MQQAATRTLKQICSCRFLFVLLFSQFLSLLITSTGVLSTFLQQYRVAMPTTQSFFNYFTLTMVYMPLFIIFKIKKTPNNLSVWKYALFALADVEANYMVVKAYQYTTITSVMLLDCFSIPCVMILSKVILRVKYKWTHYVGVMLCLAGLSVLVLSDYLDQKPVTEEQPQQAASWHWLLGDALCLVGAVLYAISNVGQEYALKHERHTKVDQQDRPHEVYNGVEYLAWMGMFGSIISAIQVLILERDEIVSQWNGDRASGTLGPILGLLFGFGIVMFLLYSLVPHFLRLSSATFMNLSFLASDFYAVIASIFLLKHPVC